MLILGLLFIAITIVVIGIIAHNLFGWIRETRPTVRLSELRTGDIMQTSPNNIGRHAFALVGIHGSHAFMAVRDDSTGVLSTLEITGYRDNPGANARPNIRPMSERLDTEYDMFVSVWRYKGPHIPSEKVYEYLEQVKDMKFNYDFTKEHLKQRFFGWHRTLNKKRLCCSETVYMCLVYCGVLKYNEYDFNDSFRLLMKLPTHSRAHDLVVEASDLH